MEMPMLDDKDEFTRIQSDPFYKEFFQKFELSFTSSKCSNKISTFYNYIQFMLTHPHPKSKEDISGTLRAYLSKINEEDSRKCPNTANKYRHTATSLFVKKCEDKERRVKLLDSLDNYNLALCHSSFNSNTELEETSKLFANRSAVLLELKEYDLAIEDINTALKYNYPINLHWKLILRKAKCLASVDKNSEALNVINDFKTSNSYSKDPDVSKKFQDLEAEILNAPPPQPLKKEKAFENEEKRRIFCTRPYSENPKFVFASETISIARSKEKGRHVVAADDIYMGDVLFDEVPYASVLIPSAYPDYCFHCAAYAGLYMFPCKNCCEVRFCSENCYKDAWDQYHKFDCHYSKFLHNNFGLGHLALRIALTAGIDKITQTIIAQNSLSNSDHKLQDIEVYKKESCDYSRIFSLVSPFKQFNPETIFQFAKNISALSIWLLTKTKFFVDRKNTKELSLVGGVILKHFMQLICNAQRVYAFKLYNSEEKFFNLLEGGERIIIGSAIYASTSLMNHSCDPNIATSYKYKRGEGRRFIVKSTRRIKKGEEVTNSYGVTYQRDHIAKRQLELYAQYSFKCTCSKCILEYETGNLFVDQFHHGICDTKGCEGFVICPPNFEGQNSCYTCNNVSNIEKKLNAIDEAEEMREKAEKYADEKNYDISLKLFQRGMNCILAELKPTHHMIAQFHDYLAKIYFYKRDFKRAIDHLKISVKHVQERYGSFSNEHGIEVKKLMDMVQQGAGIKNGTLLNTLPEELSKSIELAGFILEIYSPSTDLFNSNNKSE